MCVCTHGRCGSNRSCEVLRKSLKPLEVYEVCEPLSLSPNSNPVLSEFGIFDGLPGLKYRNATDI